MWSKRALLERKSASAIRRSESAGKRLPYRWVASRMVPHWLPRRLSGPRWGALLAVPIVAGCVELPPMEKQKVEQARQAYERRDYRTATATLDKVLALYGNTWAGAEPYYLRALCRARSNDKSGALADARKCIELARSKLLAANCRATAGSIEFEAGNEAAALEYYGDAIDELPEKPGTDLIRFRYATCLQRQGRWADARNQFAIVVQRYPTSDLAENARRMYEWPVDHFAIQCGAFRDRGGASVQAAKLARAGLPARVEPRDRLGKPLYMVFVGQYPTYSEAQAALPGVKRHVSGAVIAP